MTQLHSVRIKEIIFIFAKYGFGYLFNNKKNKIKKSPSNFRKALEELGPTFIKAGQILSTRPDILPKEYINELIKLQDSTAQESFSKMKEVFEESLALKTEDVFSYINTEPIASASISQVYEGTLKDGRKVAVKIQRPDIFNKMNDDIDILIKFFKLTKNKINISVVDPIEVLNEIKNSMIIELNFKIEAENIEKFRKYNSKVNYVYIPYVINEYCSSRVIVLENINGIKINMINELEEQGNNIKDLALKLTLNYCKQIFEDGFFHGDPHPGNILVTNNKICFIDFGIMGYINENMREYFNKAIIGIVSNDKEKLTNSIIAISIKKGRVNKADIYEGVSYLLDMYMEASIKNIELSVFIQELLDIARKNNIAFPADFTALMRGLIILEGIISELNPELQMIDIIVSYINENRRINILKYLIKEEFLNDAFICSRDSLKIPSKTIDMLNKISNGKLELNVSNNNISKIFNMAKKITGIFVLGIICSVLILSSSYFIVNKTEPLYKNISIMGIMGYSIALIILIRIIFFIKKTNN